jgi:hypothetical protein
MFYALYLNSKLEIVLAAAAVKLVKIENNKSRKQ